MLDRWSRAPDQAPDQIEPIIGYRAWIYNVQQDHERLHSFFKFGVEWDGACRSWVTASCRHERPFSRHTAPAEGCTCGFYAMKAMCPEIKGLTALAQRFRTFEHTSSGIVLGRVELAGKVIEHEHGYRAERARIVELIPIRGSERRVTILARGLDVPVGSPIDVRPLSLAHPVPPRPDFPRPVVVAGPESRDWSPVWAVVVGLLYVLGWVALHVARP